MMDAVTHPLKEAVAIHGVMKDGKCVNCLVNNIKNIYANHSVFAHSLLLFLSVPADAGWKTIFFLEHIWKYKLVCDS